jgi:polar amino acid transport system substrate-binding protein
VLSISCFGNDKVVKVATLEDYAPFCKTDEKHKAYQTIKPNSDAQNFHGYSWDVLRESYHVMGYTVELFISPCVRSLREVKQGNYDIIFPTGVNTERKKVFDYSKESINEANYVIYVNADSSIEWKGLSSFYGKTIGVKTAFSYGDEWTNEDKITKNSVKTMLQGFKMLQLHRFEGFLGYEYNCDYILKQNGMQKEFKKFPAFGSSLEYLVALKTNPKGKELLRVFDEGKRKLRKSGKLDKIKQKWFGN